MAFALRSLPSQLYVYMFWWEEAFVASESKVAFGDSYMCVYLYIYIYNIYIYIYIHKVVVVDN